MFTGTIAWPKPDAYPGVTWSRERSAAWRLATDMYARGVAYEPMWTDFVSRAETQTGEPMPDLKTYVQIAHIADGTTDVSGWSAEQKHNITYLALFSSRRHIQNLEDAQQVAKRIADIERNNPLFFYYLTEERNVPDAPGFEFAMATQEAAAIDDVWVKQNQMTPKIGEYRAYIDEIENAILADPRADIMDKVTAYTLTYTPDELRLWTELTMYPDPATLGGTLDNDAALRLYATFSVFQTLLPYRQRMEDINDMDFDTDLDKFTNTLMDVYIRDILDDIMMQMKIYHNNLVNNALLSASPSTPSTLSTPPSTPSTTSTPGGTTGTTPGSSSTDVSGDGGGDGDDDDGSTPSPPPNPATLPVPTNEQAAYLAEHERLVQLFDFYYEENRQIANARGRPIAAGVQNAYQKIHAPLDFGDQRSVIDARVDDAREANDTFRAFLVRWLDDKVEKTGDTVLADEWAVVRELDRPLFFETYRQVVAARVRIDEARSALVRRKIAAYGKQLDALAALGAPVSQYQTFIATANAAGVGGGVDHYEAMLIAIEKGLTDLVASHKPSGVDDPQWDAEKTSEVPDFLKFYVKYARADIADALVRNVEKQKTRYLLVVALLSQLSPQTPTERIDELAVIDSDKFSAEQLEEFTSELDRYETEIYLALRAKIENDGNFALLAEFDAAAGAQASDAAKLDHFYREHIRTQSAAPKPTDQVVVEYRELVQMALRMGFEFDSAAIESTLRDIADDDTLATGTMYINDLRARLGAHVSQYARDIDAVYPMAGTDALNAAVSAGLAPDEQYVALQTAETRQHHVAQTTAALMGETTALETLFDSDIGQLPALDGVFSIPASAECIAEIKLERDAPLRRLNAELTPNDRKVVLRANPALLAECEALALVEPTTDAECKDALVRLYTLKATVDAAIQAVAESPYRKCRAYVTRFEDAFGENAELAPLTEIDVKEAALEILNDARMMKQIAMTNERSNAVNASFNEFVKDMGVYRAFQKTRGRLQNVSKELDEHVAPSARDAFYTLIGYENRPAASLDATLEFNELEQNTTAAFTAFRKTFDAKLLDANMERDCLRTLVGYRQLVIAKKIAGDAKIDELMQLTKDITPNDVEQASEELFDDIIEATNEKEEFLKRERKNLDTLLAPIRAFNAAHPVDPDAEVAKQIEAQKTFIRQLAIYARADPPRPL
jgi:hypothetical protein